jgi:hypothetical protein
MNLSTIYLTILPERDKELTLHQLSININLTFINLSFVRMKNMKKNGTQVPGPFEIK